MLPEIFLKAVVQEFSGILDIVSPQCSKLIYFKNGNVVFVESNDREETFGHFLLRKKLIDPKSLNEALQELTSQIDLKLGEILLKKRLIDPSALMEQLNTHQEEKLFNAFAMKRGEVRVVNNMKWPDYVTTFPLRTLNVFFKAIEKHFSQEEIERHCMLSSNASVQIKHQPLRDLALPPFATRLLKSLNRDLIRVDALSDKLFVEMDQIITYLYIFKLGDWVHVEPPSKDKTSPKFHSEDVSGETHPRPEGSKLSEDNGPTVVELPPESHSQEQQMVEKIELSPMFIQRIELEHKKMESTNFYQMFMLSPEFTLQQLQVKFFQVIAFHKKYDEHPLGKEMLSWIKTGYEVLRDPVMRSMYDRRFSFRKRDAAIERGERDFYKALRMIENNEMDAALRLLIDINSKAIDSTFKAYHAFVLLRLDPKNNLQESCRIITEAFKIYPADPYAHYIAGNVEQYQKNFIKAEKHYRAALQVYPDYQDAQTALDNLRFEKTKEKHLGEKEKKEKAKNEKPGFFDLSVGGFKFGGKD